MSGGGRCLWGGGEFVGCRTDADVRSTFFATIVLRSQDFRNPWSWDWVSHV
jgi:hypothetical protein